MSQTAIELGVLGLANPLTSHSSSLPPISRVQTRPSVSSPTQSADGRIAEQVEASIPKARASIVIVAVSFITGLSTLLAGLVTVAIPTIAADVGLGRGLLLWPSSIYALVCGCTLLISGACTDVVGSRRMFFVGCFLQSLCTVACGLSRTGMQLIVFRAFGGLANSCCLPSAVSIITGTFTGRQRNTAFAFMGGGQPIGFGVGLFLGGVLTESIGWRWGFYLSGILNMALLVLMRFGLAEQSAKEVDFSWRQLSTGVDWVGAFIASTLLAFISYVFASLAATGSQSIKSPLTITLLAASSILAPAFPYWMRHQSQHNRPALIPNSLWRNKAFSCICLCVLLTWASFNVLEQFLTLYFQYVQLQSPIQTSLRFLPAPISGAAANAAMALLVHRVRADWILLVSFSVTCAAPLLMAVSGPEWTYWAAGFPSVLLNPLGADSLFTISNLVITSAFPAETQALAGGVFNTVSQVGKSFGLALAAVIADEVTAHVDIANHESPLALLAGYRVVFWICFALNVGTLVFSVWGLRSIGKVGHKRE